MCHAMVLRDPLNAAIFLSLILIHITKIKTKSFLFLEIDVRTWAVKLCWWWEDQLTCLQGPCGSSPPGTVPAHPPAMWAPTVGTSEVHHLWVQDHWSVHTAVPNLTECLCRMVQGLHLTTESVLKSYPNRWLQSPSGYSKITVIVIILS
jgi:hypothetical protein